MDDLTTLYICFHPSKYIFFFRKYVNQFDAENTTIPMSLSHSRHESRAVANSHRFAVALGDKTPSRVVECRSTLAQNM